MAGAYGRRTQGSLVQPAAVPFLAQPVPGSCPHRQPHRSHLDWPDSPTKGTVPKHLCPSPIQGLESESRSLEAPIFQDNLRSPWWLDSTPSLPPRPHCGFSGSGLLGAFFLQSYSVNNYLITPLLWVRPRRGLTQLMGQPGRDAMHILASAQRGGQKWW